MSNRAMLILNYLNVTKGQWLLLKKEATERKSS